MLIINGYMKKKKIPFMMIADSAAPALLLAYGIARIGCHLAGLTDGTHGNPSSLPWAIDFGDGIPRHPVNLYEVIFLFGLAFFMVQKEKSVAYLRGVPHSLPNGLRFKIFMVGYLLWRFFVEFIKPVWVLPMGLSVIQLATIAGMFYYVGRNSFRPKIM